MMDPRDIEAALRGDVPEYEFVLKHEAIFIGLGVWLASGLPIPGERQEALEFIAGCVKLMFHKESSSWEFRVKIEFILVNHLAPLVQSAFFELLKGTRAKLVLKEEKDFESQPILLHEDEPGLPSLDLLFN
jgi:hypothetical protein